MEGSLFDAGLALAGWGSVCFVCFFFFFAALAFWGGLLSLLGGRGSLPGRAAGEEVMDWSAACALGGSKVGSSAFWVASQWAYNSLALWPSEAFVSGVKDTDFRFVGKGVEEGGGEDSGCRVSADGAAFRASAWWGVSPFWVSDGAVDFRCDVLVFFGGLVVARLGVVEGASMTVSLVCLRFFSLTVSVLGRGWEVGLASSLACLSFRPSFFQAGM